MLFEIPYLVMHKRPEWISMCYGHLAVLNIITLLPRRVMSWIGYWEILIIKFVANKMKGGLQAVFCLLVGKKVAK